ncbi:MAG: TrkA family potassium uptake protein [Oscillospiraceae bacterium]|nr:TrkA family potassium uptake protein [Oscillospiraceae bacterium]
MKSILLVGLGRFGRHIAIKLNELGHEVMAVDHNEERINAVLPYVTNALIGDSTNEEFLHSIGVANFDVCIVAIGDDFQSSLETTSLLKELGGKLVVSRATRDVHEKFLLRNGADHVVYPEKQLGIWTAITYSSEKVFDYIDLGENHVIMEVSIPDNWVGKTIFDIDVRKNYGINILAIRDSGKLSVNITGNTAFESDQTLLVLGTNEKILECFNI